ncbi:MAG: enolase C-terminal domain-like protein [Actinoallomurus sp.]
MVRQGGYGGRRAAPVALLLLLALDGHGLPDVPSPAPDTRCGGSPAPRTAARTPVQIGENFAGPRAMSLALTHGASDLVMPDLERIGGVSGWLDAATLADVAGTPMSSHLYSEVSAHLLAATPTAHWLEYVGQHRCPKIAATIELTRQFAEMLVQLRGKDLDEWADRAEAGPVRELRSFAAGLRRDWDAVKAGLSGVVGGNVNRIKMIKRQMYGRANHDLLRKHVLLME